MNGKDELLQILRDLRSSGVTFKSKTTNEFYVRGKASSIRAFRSKLRSDLDPRIWSFDTYVEDTKTIVRIERVQSVSWVDFQYPLNIGKSVFGDKEVLVEGPHYAVIGRTGSGKTNFLKNKLDEQVKLGKKIAIIDMKPNNTDWDAYIDREPLISEVIKDDISKASHLLELLSTEDLKHHEGICVFIDEVHNITANANANKWLIKLAREGRANGIQLFLATTKATADALASAVLTNCEPICFRLSHNREYKLFLSNPVEDVNLGRGVCYVNSPKPTKIKTELHTPMPLRFKNEATYELSPHRLEDRQIDKVIRFALANDQKISKDQVMSVLSIGFQKATTFVNLLIDKGVLTEYKDNSKHLLNSYEGYLI